MSAYDAFIDNQNAPIASAGNAVTGEAERLGLYLAGEVEGDEGGGAGGVDDEARAGEAEGVGDPVGDHVEGLAGGPVGAHAGEVAGAEVGVVVPHGAEEDAGGGAGEGVDGDAGVLEGLRVLKVKLGRPGQFEAELALLKELRAQLGPTLRLRLGVSGCTS